MISQGPTQADAGLLARPIRPIDPSTTAAFSFEPVLTQSAWFRPHNRSEDVPGLYLVGAGTHPGAGLPGVVSSAKVLEGLLRHV